MAQIRNVGSPKHEEQLRRLAEFLDLDAIEYTDRPDQKGEDYKLTKGNRSFVIHVRGTKDQGGFLAVEKAGPNAQPKKSAPSRLDLAAAKDLDKLIPLS